jgi:hypothetical protein
MNRISAPRPRARRAHHCLRPAGEEAPEGGAETPQPPCDAPGAKRAAPGGAPAGDSALDGTPLEKKRTPLRRPLA